jgi:hypothetical protein
MFYFRIFVKVLISPWR